MAISTTGKPNTQDYNLGRGEVLFGTLNATDKPTAWRHVGNCTSFGVTVETDRLKHQSSLAGLKVTDLDVVISQEVQLAITLDETINFDNMSDFLSGAATTYVNPYKATNQAQYSWLPSADFTVLRYYDLVGETTAGGAPEPTDRYYGVKASDLTLTVDDSPTFTVLTLDTDYNLDGIEGRVFILDTPKTTGVTPSIKVDGATLKIDLNTAGISPLDQVQGLTQTAIKVAVKFISQNAANSNKKLHYQFHKVTLAAEGDWGQISDEVSEMTFAGTAEKNAIAGGAASPTLTITDLHSMVVPV